MVEKLKEQKWRKETKQILKGEYGGTSLKISQNELQSH